MTLSADVRFPWNFPAGNCAKAFADSQLLWKS